MNVIQVDFILNSSKRKTERTPFFYTSIKRVRFKQKIIIYFSKPNAQKIENVLKFSI